MARKSKHVVYASAFRTAREDLTGRLRVKFLSAKNARRDKGITIKFKVIGDANLRREFVLKASTLRAITAGRILDAVLRQSRPRVDEVGSKKSGNRQTGRRLVRSDSRSVMRAQM